MIGFVGLMQIPLLYVVAFTSTHEPLFSIDIEMAVLVNNTLCCHRCDRFNHVEEGVEVKSFDGSIEI